MIVYRAQHPQSEEEKADYLNLLKANLIRPTQLDICVMNADGSNKRRRILQLPVSVVSFRKLV